MNEGGIRVYELPKVTITAERKPRRESPEKRNVQTPDLRTTIHWQPVVQTDSEDVASFEFYTANDNTSYTVIIEGLANDGSIIRIRRRLAM